MNNELGETCYKRYEQNKFHISVSRSKDDHKYLSKIQNQHYFPQKIIPV